MEAIKAEIERKKRQLEEKKLVDGERKYFRRSDLSAAHRASFDERRGLTAAKTASHPDDDPEGGAAVRGVDECAEGVLSRTEVMRRLRERLQPILLFGETEREAFTRLRRLEILEPEITRGLRNDFQEAMEKVDRAYLEEVLKSGHNDADSEKNKVEEPRITWSELCTITKHLGTEETSSSQNADILLKLYKFLLAEWEDQISRQPDDERRTTRYKISLATYKQTQTYLRPLFRQLRNGSLSGDILEALIEIAQFMMQRNYLKASDTYLQMAIGNAAWPIGVTMVGIHARTGREKIFSRHLAHVLNDETQRKYIQALKRLMTKCQELYPTDPSRSVEFGGLTRSE